MIYFFLFRLVSILIAVVFFLIFNTRIFNNFIQLINKKEIKEFLFFSFIIPILLVIIFIYFVDLYGFLIEYIILAIIIGNIIWFIKQPKKYIKLIKSYLIVERSVLPKFYSKFYDSIIFRILRIITGFIFLFTALNFKLLTKKEIIVYYYNLVQLYPFFWIIFIIFIGTFIIMLFDLFFVNFFLFYKSTNILQKAYLQAGFGQGVTNLAGLYIQKCLIVGGKFTCKFVASSVLGAGALSSIDSTFESRGFKPVFFWIYGRPLYFIGLGENPNNLSEDMIKSNKRYVEPNSVLTKFVNWNQHRSNSAMQGFAKLKEFYADQNNSEFPKK